MEAFDGRHAFGGKRVSAQRRAIAEAARAMGSAFTVENLHEAMIASRGTPGLATLYRAVGALVDAGTLAPVGSRDGSALYAWCGRGDHHHHLVCTACGKVAGVACPVGDKAHRTAEESGFTLTGHDITLYGLCADCRTTTEPGAL